MNRANRAPVWPTHRAKARAARRAARRPVHDV